MLKKDETCVTVENTCTEGNYVEDKDNVCSSGLERCQEKYYKMIPTGRNNNWKPPHHLYLGPKSPSYSKQDSLKTLKDIALKLPSIDYESLENSILEQFRTEQSYRGYSNYQGPREESYGPIWSILIMSLKRTTDKKERESLYKNVCKNFKGLNKKKIIEYMIFLKWDINLGEEE